MSAVFIELQRKKKDTFKIIFAWPIKYEPIRKSYLKPGSYLSRIFNNYLPLTPLRIKL